MFCPKCGGSSQNEALKFCNVCGANLYAVRQVIDTRETGEKLDWSKTWVADMLLSEGERKRRARELELQRGITPEVKRLNEIKGGAPPRMMPCIRTNRFGREERRPLMAEAPLPFKPNRQQLIEAAGKTVPDVIGHDLRVLFCGINPGLYTAAVGHHFARPGNRFWPALHRSGFTDRLLSPFEERQLLELGLGVTNVVARATAAASELTNDDFIKGGARLREKVRRYQPRLVAVLGVGAYRTAFARPGAVIGEQDERIAEARIWVLPNPSGLNANYQLPELVKLFEELRKAAAHLH
jgi:double-stranded uracil-DNA glycosylase